MAHPIPFYRLYLNETLRKHLGINLKNKKIYVFKLKQKTYLSTDTVPVSVKFEKINVKLGYSAWFINIPLTMLDYEPIGYRLLNTQGKVLELIREWKNKKK